MKILKLTLVLCLTFSSTLGLDEWMPITESPDVTEEEPKWSEDCTADLEKVFMGENSIDLNDDLSMDGKNLTWQVLRARSCDVLTDDRVVFCTISERIFKSGCNRALREFKLSLTRQKPTNVQDEILGCGFSSRRWRGSALVCLKSTQDTNMLLRKSVKESCNDYIEKLYSHPRVTKDEGLEREAERSSNKALADSNCDHVDANRCRVLPNAVSDSTVMRCRNFVKGISGNVKRHIGCKFIHGKNAKAALTCIFRKD